MTSLKSRWRKWGGRVVAVFGTAACLMLGSAVLFVLSAFVASFLRNSKLPLVEAKDVVEASVHRKILEATATIESEKGHARGYWIPEQNLLITNHHVVESLCPSTDCSQYNLKVETYGVSKKLDGPWRVLRCIEWLDLCAVTNSKRAALTFPPDQKTLTSAELFTAYMIPMVDDSTNHSKLTFGNVQMTSEWWGEGTLRSRRGYSGSPLFTKTGDFAGIITGASRPNATNSFIKSLWETLIVVYSNKRADQVNESAWVSAPSVTKLLLCRASGSDTSCIREQLNAFIDEKWQLLMGHNLSGCGPRWKRLRAANSAKTFHDEVCHSLPHLFPATPEAKILSELCDAVSPSRSQDSRDKISEYLREPLWLQTYVLLGVTTHFSDNSDFLDDLKSRTSDVRATVFIESLQACLL